MAGRSGSQGGARQSESQDRVAGSGLPEHVDISVLVPVLNEERHIRETVAAMLAQRFDGSFELLFADGRSEDRTREILEELAAEDPRIRMFDNPRRGTASGLNVCLREARGEYVARMDAHTYYGDRYLAAGVERLRRGDTEWVSGPQVPQPVGRVSRAVGLALGSRLGRGGSRKWDEDVDAAEERELDTGVFGGVWRRDRVLAAGGWDERWPINQDSELASRFLRDGARLICLPEMAAQYVPRDSLTGLMRQYYGYGLYRARTFRRHPQSMRRSHLMPSGLALTALLALIAPRPLRVPARLAMSAYFLAVAGTAASAARPGRREDAATVLAVLPAMHFAWGVGSLAGMLRFGVPVGAVATLLGADASAADERVEEDVYAPSLHDGGA